ncbi:MAG: OsmC family protein [Gemmatimonadota bacterium]|nr:OsmC family protein [Gemmatimonadota bacterium]
MTVETKRVTLDWQERLIFRGGEPDGPAITIDGDNGAAPGPMLTLLLAAAACTGADVVAILEKMRVTVQACRIEASGDRRETEPRRYTSIHLAYHLRGAGLDEAKARRAIDLSITKYCSVVHSLAPDLRVTHGLTLG